LEKYLDELQGSEDYESILQVHSLDQLLNSLSSVPIATPGNYSSLASIHRLAPRLKFVDDFAAVLAVCFGADAALTAAVWGSIRLILTHASTAAETLQDVMDMLEELSLTLPRLQVYEQRLPLNQPLQQALVDVYCEIICFYARTIHFLRSNPHLVVRKHAWVDFRNDFSRTMLRIKRMSSTVESQADIVRMQQDEGRYKEVLELLSSMTATDKSKTEQIRYNNIPFPTNAKFSGREDVLESVHEALSPQVVSSSLQSLALFGMGGVGKTQIALQYAYQGLDHFDVVLWVAADNEIAIGQSFRAIGEGLGLFRTDDETKDAAAALMKVKNWLVTTRASSPYLYPLCCIQV
jgi:hypothetical protein